MSRNVFTLVAGNLGSKALALVREVLFAAWFGTGNTAVGFRVAQTLYLLPVQALLGDAINGGLIPLYKRMREEDPDAARGLVILVAAFALAFSGIVSTLLYVYASEWAGLIAPGIAGEAMAVAAKLLKVLALATPFFVLGGMLCHIEAAFGRYSGIASRPILINLGAITGAGMAVYSGHDLWLAWGLVACHVAVFAWSLWSMCQLDRFMPTSPLGLARVREIGMRFWRTTVPLLGLPLVAQGNLVVERIVSSWLGPSIIPSVDYARFLTDTMVQLIAVPLSIVTIATHGGSANADLAREHVRKTAAFLLLVAFPIAAFIGIHAEAVVRVLFARGAFDEASVASTSEVLRWMGLGLATNIPAYYLVRGLNAQMRNREALVATIAGCFGNVAVNLSLWPVLGPKTIGVGLAVYGLSIAAYCILRLGLWRDVRILIAAQVLIWGGFLGALSTMPTLSAPVDLAVGALATVAVWLASVYLVPELSRTFDPIATRIRWLPRPVRGSVTR